MPLQQVPVPGRKFETLSMDYNFLANQSVTVNGPVSQRPAYERQMREGLLQGFRRAYKGNRAPLIIGNHFEDWNGGVYMDAVEDVMKGSAPRRASAASPSGSWPTGSTRRTRASSPSCAPWRWVRSPPEAGALSWPRRSRRAG